MILFFTIADIFLLLGAGALSGYVAVKVVFDNHVEAMPLVTTLFVISGFNFFKVYDRVKGDLPNQYDVMQDGAYFILFLIASLFYHNQVASRVS